MIRTEWLTWAADIPLAGYLAMGIAAGVVSYWWQRRASSKTKSEASLPSPVSLTDEEIEGVRRTLTLPEIRAAFPVTFRSGRVLQSVKSPCLRCGGTIDHAAIHGAITRPVDDMVLIDGAAACLSCHAIIRYHYRLYDDNRMAIRYHGTWIFLSPMELQRLAWQFHLKRLWREARRYVESLTKFGK